MQNTEMGDLNHTKTLIEINLFFREMVDCFDCGSNISFF